MGSLVFLVRSSIQATIGVNFADHSGVMPRGDSRAIEFELFE
jgi:hypothetical protein